MAGAVLLALLAVGCAGPKRVSVTPGPDVSPPATITIPPVEGRPSAPLLIRIGLATALDRISIGTSGPCLLSEGDQRRPVARLDAAAEISVRPQGGRLAWQAIDDHGTAVSLFVQPLAAEQTLTWRDRPYGGEFLLLPGSDGLTVINVIELEAYLAGVVPWEIGRHGSAEIAALEAQAVAARTYTIAHLNERAALGFDVWGDVQDQVYMGAFKPDRACNEAIARTAGLVLRYEGQEIEAYYCSTCGGHTSSIEEVWPRSARPYLRAHSDGPDRSDPFCAEARYFAWQVTWEAAALEKILQTTLPQYVLYMQADGRATWAGVTFTGRTSRADWRRPGRLRGLVISERTTSGRVGRLDVATDAGVYHVRGDRVRWVLLPPDGNPAILRSAKFQLRVFEGNDGRPLQVMAIGNGFGHGVGLCQTGALAMSRRGYTSRQILAHYYPGARLDPANPRAQGPR